MQHISILLAEKILSLLEESGAVEIEKLAALDIARSVIPVGPGSLYIKTQDAEAAAELPPLGPAV